MYSSLNLITMVISYGPKKEAVPVMKKQLMYAPMRKVEFTYAANTAAISLSMWLTRTRLKTLVLS